MGLLWQLFLSFVTDYYSFVLMINVCLFDFFGLTRHANLRSKYLCCIQLKMTIAVFFLLNFIHPSFSKAQMVCYRYLLSNFFHYLLQYYCRIRTLAATGCNITIRYHKLRLLCLFSSIMNYRIAP